MAVYKRRDRDGKPGKYWWYRFRFNGQEISRSSKSVRRAVAEAAEREHREELARVYRGGQPRKRFTEAMLDYLRHCELTLKPSTHERYVVSCKALIPYFEGKYLDEIKRAQIAEFRDYRRSTGVSPSTINRDVSCLSGMFEFAIERDMSDNNPCRSVRKFKEPPGKQRYLDKEEYEAIIKKATETAKEKRFMLAEMITVAVYTGMRQQEQFTLTWDQVDMDKRTIYLPETKAGRPRTIHMLDPVYAVLKRLPKHFHTKYVFYKWDGSRFGDRKKTLATLISDINAERRKAELKEMPRFTWHDLRRTCGCWQLQAGVPMESVRELLGHSSIATTEKCYAFLRHEDVRREMERGQKRGRKNG